MNLLDACKLAYRKHHLNDESIGWDELGNCLLDALCNAMGDDGYQQWLQQVNSPDSCKHENIGVAAHFEVCQDCNKVLGPYRG